VRSDQFQRYEQTGPALDREPLVGVNAVRGPHPVRTLEDLQVDPPAAGRAGLDLDVRMRGSQLVQQPIEGERLVVHPGPPGRGMAGVDQVAVVVPLQVRDVVVPQ